MKLTRTKIATKVRVQFREKQLKGPEVGLCWKPATRKYRDRCGKCKPITIEVDPRQTPREYLLTTVHEWFHAALPNLSEKKIIQLERSLGPLLWRLGYRCHGRGSPGGEAKKNAAIKKVLLLEETIRIAKEDKS